MRQSNALKGLLRDSTRLYAGERVPVRFTDSTPHYAGEASGGPYLAVNPDVNGYYEPDPPVSGANELRLLRDTLSHEAFEYRLGHPNAKAAFMLRHGRFVDMDGDEVDDVEDLEPRGATPSPKAKAAGTVYNILRDAWVNTARCRRFPGLRRTFAFKADLLAGDHDVSELPVERALIAGLQQVSLTNTARGIQDADEDVRTLLGWVRRYVEAARVADTHDELAAIADRVMEKFGPAFEDADDEFMDLLDTLDAMTMRVDVDDMSRDELADALDGGDVSPSTGGMDDEGLEGVTVAVTGGGHSSTDDPEDAPQSPADTPDVADADAADYYDGLDDAMSGDDEDAGQGTGQDADGREDDESGLSGDASGSPGHTVDLDEDDDRLADAVADLLDDMDDHADDDLRAGDALGLDDADDYHEPDEGDEDSFERVRDEALFSGTEWGTRMDDRDAYDYDFVGDEDELPAEDIRELMRTTGLAEDIRRAFSQIKTREVTEPTKRRTKRLNLRNVVRHMSGDYGERRVYERTYRGASGGRTICAVVDGSGSMGGGGSIGPANGYPRTGAIVDAKVLLAALHIAANEIGDRLVATSFMSNSKDDVRLITGPDESFAWDHLDGFAGAASWTPTAAGVLDGLRLLRRAGGNDRVMVVITDGRANRNLEEHPTWSSLNVGGPPEDARHAVELARDEGITVFGVGVGDSINESRLTEMFGAESWVHVESDALVDEVVRMYRDQLDDDRVADVSM